MNRILAIIIIGLLAVGCSKQEDEQLVARKKNKANLRTLSRISALPEDVKAPLSNPTTEKKVELGRLLFFDPVLSGNKDVACATCHHPENGYAESLEISIGVNGKGFGSKRAFRQPNDIPFTKRNAHTVINTAFNGIDYYRKYEPESAPMFWDLRTQSLEDQALEPIKALEEMRGNNYSEDGILTVVTQRLKAIPEYQQRFDEVFGGPDAVSPENLGKAIAAFERTLVTNNSRFDQYMRGDKSAISLSEQEGFALFKKVGCANCHNGPMFSDYKTHVLGVAENSKLGQPDTGLDETYAFRTPTLRNLRFTFPYMHNGTIKSLQRVLEFYEDLSFGKVRNPAVKKEQLDPLVKELNLSVRDMSSIISFLNTLNDDSFDRTVPESVPSGLAVGGNIE